MTPAARCVVLLCAGWSSVAAIAQTPAWIVESRDGVVAADSADASDAGARILREGGNAFDAAIATSLALTVARPASTGIGGGGFFLGYVARERQFVALDFRESAPRAATPERYAELARKRGDGPSASIFGGNAIAVPGLLKGLAEIRKRHGTRDFAALVRPAYELAERGVLFDEQERDACISTRREIERFPALALTSQRLHDKLIGDGQPPALGSRRPRLDLAAAFTLIGKSGAAAMYDGPLGEDVLRAVNQAGGAMTPEDLRDYRVRDVTPLRATYRGHEIVAFPPPSSGGVCLIETLQILEAAQGREALRAAPREHLLVESMKHAFADRARHLGDPEFARLPVERLLSREYAADRAATILPDRTRSPESYGHDAPPTDDRGTSHLCVVDRNGNIALITETINGTHGSLVMTERYGILLNNEMDDFLTVQGEANLFGLTQSPANQVGPGKRPLSSMSPTIVLRDGEPVFALGASGGPRIITAVLQVLTHLVDGESLASAIESPRLHHQWRPDEVRYDRAPTGEVLDALRACGHAIGTTRATAVVQAIQRTADGAWRGACDPRKGGRPASASPH